MSLADMLGGPNLGEEDEDEAMDGDASSNGSGGSGVSEDEGEGVDLRNDSGQGDSSEEEDEGSDAEREVRAGKSFYLLLFIIFVCYFLVCAFLLRWEDTYDSDELSYITVEVLYF